VSVSYVFSLSLLLFSLICCFSFLRVFCSFFVSPLLGVLSGLGWRRRRLSFFPVFPLVSVLFGLCTFGPLFLSSSFFFSLCFYGMPSVRSKKIFPLDTGPRLILFFSPPFLWLVSAERFPFVGLSSVAPHGLNSPAPYGSPPPALPWGRQSDYPLSPRFLFSVPAFRDIFGTAPQLHLPLFPSLAGMFPLSFCSLGLLLFPLVRFNVSSE